MTHFWTTGDTDDAVWSYYMDGEATPSVQFRAPQATGTFFGDEARVSRVAHAADTS